MTFSEAVVPVLHLGLEAVKLSGHVQTIQQPAEATERPTSLEVRLRCIERRPSSERSLLLWETFEILWQEPDAEEGGALGSRECRFNLLIPSDIDKTLFRRRNSSKSDRMHWTLEAILRYPRPVDSTKPAKTTRQLIDLPIALHQPLPSSPFHSPPDDSLRRRSVSVTPHNPKRFRSPSRTSSRTKTDEQHDHERQPRPERRAPLLSSAQETNDEDKPANRSVSLHRRIKPLDKEMELSLTCRFTSEIPPPPLVVSQLRQELTPASSGRRTQSSRGRGRASEPTTTPFYDIVTPIPSCLASKHRRTASCSCQGELQAMGHSIDAFSSIGFSSRRRRSTRPSTSPSLDRDPNFVPPAFGAIRAD